MPAVNSGRHLPWHVWVAGVYLAINVALLIVSYPPDGGPDWDLWSALPESIARGAMYDTGTEAPFVWSPVAGWFMATVPTVIGYWPWYALHIGVVFLMRDWRLIAITLATAGIWIDAAMGNTFTFIFVSGVLAYRGSRPAALVYLALLLLIPRPLQVPLGAWLLWKMPSVRVPFVGMAAIHAIAVFASGYAFDWAAALGAQAANGNFGPTALIGPWWFIVGVPLAVWLTLKGHVGFAGLAISPYILGVYWLMPALELPPWKRRPWHPEVHSRKDRDATTPAVRVPTGVH